MPLIGAFLSEYMMENDLSTLAQFSRVIGSLFFYEPNVPQNQPIVALFQTGQWQTECDFLSENKRGEIQQNLQMANLSQLDDDFQTLFIGPNNLVAPPWGSVYLDKESVVFGESLLTLRTFLQENGIQFSLVQNEPEDHIGLMFMLTAYFAENHPDLLKVFWRAHFLTWAYRFFELFNAESPSFYRGIGMLAERLLHHWQEKLEIEPLVLKLYR